MRFVDQCRVKVIAGDGGNGVAAFRREKFVPFGGPAGGDGGKGGDVVFIGDEGQSTLLDFTHSRTLKAKRGEHGQGSDCYGRGGEDLVERLPIGTQIRDAATRELIADVVAHGQKIVVAHGGKGGRGNKHFATAFDRAPRRFEKGEPGEERELDLELKVIADVGLLGFPNVGKSTFVATVSAARPKIADYPFTTLTPALGVVAVGGGSRVGGTSFVIADIPGLIPGASSGVGLGARFLKHVERTRVLLHLITLDYDEGREPLADYRAIRRELERYSPELARRPEVVALSKADLPEVREAFPALAERFARLNIELRLISAATRDGITPLVNELFQRTRSIVEERPPPAADSILLPGEKPRRAKAPKKKPVAAKKKPAAAAKKKPVAAAKKKPAAAAKKKPAAAKKASPKKAAPKKAALAKRAAKKRAPPRKAASKKVVARRSAAPKKKALPKRPVSRRVPPKKRAAPRKPARPKAPPQRKRSPR